MSNISAGIFGKLVDYVSCCVQNSRLLDKTVSTPVHPPRQSQLPILKSKYSSSFRFFLLEKAYLVPVLISRFSAKLLLGSVTHFNQTFRIE